MEPKELQIATPTDTTIVLTRRFAAPCRLVWEAMFTPDKMRRWMLPPPGWTFSSCTCDARVGGALEIAWKSDERLESFCSQTRSAQVSLLLGEHFANLEILVDHYLPKPALDYITSRMADLLRNRPPESAPQEKVEPVLDPMPGYLTELTKKGGE